MGFSNLVTVNLDGNLLTNVTLPPDMTSLMNLFVDGNPLTTLVLSELEATNLTLTVTALENRGVPVFRYPLEIKLLRPRPLVGAFQFGVTGPPGAYTVLASADLAVWNPVGFASNLVGSVSFVDETAPFVSRRFYRAQMSSP